MIDRHGKRKAKCIGESKRAAQQVVEKIQGKLSLGQFEIKQEEQPQEGKHKPSLKLAKVSPHFYS